MVEVTQDDIGEACIWVDPVGKQKPALITAVWGPQCINLVTVVDESNQTDSYGRKLERFTSVMHGSVQQAHGFYWMFKSRDE